MASKRQEIILDDEYPLDEYAFLVFRTYLQGFQLVAAINECQGIDLVRIDFPRDDDSDGDGTSQPVMPIYYYADDMVNLQYYVVDASWYFGSMTQLVYSALQAGDKVLVLHGIEARSMMQSIYKSIVELETPTDPYDILAQRKAAAWKNLAAELIDVNYYDYSNPDYPLSSQWENAPWPMPSRLQRMAGEIESFFVVVLGVIEEVAYHYLHK